jgi:spore maturation protein A
MNAIFTILFLSSSLRILFLSPDEFVSALLDGAGGAASLSVALLSSYCVWLGLMQAWEKLGITKKVANLFAPLIRKVFRIENKESIEAVGLNLSANLLGLGSAATPYGIDAAEKLQNEKEKEFASTMLFVLNAGSLQLIPTSVITLRASLHSSSPAAIFLPCFLTTIFSTFLGVLLTFVCCKKKTARFVKAGVKL